MRHPFLEHLLETRHKTDALYVSGNAEQLRMLVLGQGGTGKSLLIGAITETFVFYGQEHILAKCATTGIAATAIGAQTLHSWAALPISRPKDDTWIDKGTKESLRRRHKNIEGKVFLIEDEVSMEDKALSYDASLAVGKIKGEEGWAQSAYEPYGGMHVIKFGDFHQFPPVKNPKGALYVDRETDGRKSQLGRNIFLQFDTVVILEKQVRVTDSVWKGILDNVRIGECSEHDVHEIRKLVLGNEECEVPDFNTKPWSDAILVTPRHGVREAWNEQSVRKHCERSGNRMYTVCAEDFYRDTPREMDLDARLAVAKMKDKDTGNLQDRVQIAVGMKAMVKINYAIEADIANGTRGIIESITLDPRETAETIDENGDVLLKYPPALVVFKPDDPSTVRFEGIAAGRVPITPSASNFTAKLGSNRYRITRRQLALTPGYAFTDYKSQGQTIEYVIIDIGRPPSGSLSAFGVYVALSRSRGRSTIRLLRDFDDALFQNHPSEDLRTDMERLERLNEETKVAWLARAGAQRTDPDVFEM